MCSLQISVLFVFMRMEISLFSSGILGSCGVFLLVKFKCAILLHMGCGRSLSVLPILPTGMCFLPLSMLVNGSSVYESQSVEVCVYITCDY